MAVYLHMQNCLAWMVGCPACGLHRTRVFWLLQVIDDLHWQSGDKNLVFHYFSAADSDVCASSAQGLGILRAFKSFWGILGDLGGKAKTD